MAWMNWLIDEVLNRIGIVVGLITLFPIFWTWWEVTLGRRRRHRRWFREAQETPGLRPAVLVVDLLEKGDIRTGVENYRRSSHALKDIPDDRVFALSRTVHLDSGDMPGLVAEVRRVAADVIRAGTDTLHLFYAGPVVPMAFMGAEFGNICRVILYHHDKTTGRYENWGPLRHDPALP